MEDMSDEDGDRKSGTGEEGERDGWIEWFTTLEGHEYMVEIDKDFVKDQFNLHGLAG